MGNTIIILSMSLEGFNRPSLTESEGFYRPSPTLREGLLKPSPSQKLYMKKNVILPTQAWDSQPLPR